VSEGVKRFYTSHAITCQTSQWIRLTQVVEDPGYLRQPWVVNYAFKKLPDGAAWNPTPCAVR
jgi:hypothetical protein